MSAGCKAIIRLAKQDLGAQVKPQVLSLLSSELSRSIPDLLAVLQEGIDRGLYHESHYICILKTSW